MTKVRIYRNLHKKLYSVQEKVNGRWKVVEHTNDINLINVTFKVSEAGRQRVIKEKRKNVHAAMIGERFPFIPNSPVYRDEVTYNPYKSPHFMVKSQDKPLDKAKYVQIVNGKVIAMLPEFEGKYIWENSWHSPRKIQHFRRHE